MVAHLDAVTSLAVDPNGIYLMSGSKSLLKIKITAPIPPPVLRINFSFSSPTVILLRLFSSSTSTFAHFHPYFVSSSPGHDCSLRLWNLDSKTCVQEITAHRKKSEEAIYDVAFHPSKAYIASAGADALARVYV